MTVEEARTKRLCRICGLPSGYVAMNGIFEYDIPFYFCGGNEYAHGMCLEQERQAQLAQELHTCTDCGSTTHRSSLCAGLCSVCLESQTRESDPVPVLQFMFQGACHRIAAQSELLGRRAMKDQSADLLS